MDIKGKRVLVLGGYGLVGMAVCREWMPHEPQRLVVASLRQSQAESAVSQLRQEFPKARTEFLPAWGDVLLRAEWQQAPEGVHPRVAILAQPEKRRRLVADTLTNSRKMC